MTETLFIWSQHAVPSTLTLLFKGQESNDVAANEGSLTINPRSARRNISDCTRWSISYLSSMQRAQTLMLTVRMREKRSVAVRQAKSSSPADVGLWSGCWWSGGTVNMKTSSLKQPPGRQLPVPKAWRGVPQRSDELWSSVEQKKELQQDVSMEGHITDTSCK